MSTPCASLCLAQAATRRWCWCTLVVTLTHSPCEVYIVCCLLAIAVGAIEHFFKIIYKFRLVADGWWLVADDWRRWLMTDGEGKTRGVSRSSIFYSYNWGLLCHSSLVWFPLTCFIWRQAGGDDVVLLVLSLSGSRQHVATYWPRYYWLLVIPPWRIRHVKHEYVPPLMRPATGAGSGQAVIIIGI